MKEYYSIRRWYDDYARQAVQYNDSRPVINNSHLARHYENTGNTYGVVLWTVYLDPTEWASYVYQWHIAEEI